MGDLTNLLATWQSLDADLHDLQVQRHELELLIAAEMKEQRAEFATVTGVEATYKTGVAYIKDLDGPLATIAEELSPDELEAVLNNPKPVARQFLIPAVKKLAKRGGVFRTALDKATLEQPPQLKIRSVDK
jgi:hypothetical protein